MRRRATLILSTVAATAVIGAGVAVAADPPTCPYGNTPRSEQVAPRTDRDGDQLRLRKRDGTGPRHEQRGHRAGNRGADCPYRS